MKENEIASQIVDAALKVHRELGPGLLESVYENVLSFELAKRGLGFERQKIIPVVYEGIFMQDGFKADIIVEGRVIVEIKSIEAIHPVHYKILLTYLRVSGLKLGILINFREELLKNGIKRVVNGL